MGKFTIFIIVILLTGLAIYSPNLIRLYKLSNLYNKDTIAHNFINMDKIFFTFKKLQMSLGVLIEKAFSPIKYL